jgi:hypothetical protein
MLVIIMGIDGILIWHNSNNSNNSNNNTLWLFNIAMENGP